MMSDAPPRPASMAAIASVYQTQTTVVPTGGAGWHRVLLADPRRYWVRFVNDPAALVAMHVFPGPVPTTVIFPAGSNLPQEHKWRDCPSVVSGEWWAYSSMAAQLWVTECLYVGD